MTRLVRTVPLRSRTRSSLPFLLTFTGLTVIIIGILAMHVWMGGHGSTTHHVTAPSTTTTSTASTASTSGDDFGHEVANPGHTHDGAGTTMTGALTPAAAIAAVDVIQAAAMANATTGLAVDDGSLTGCAGGCADEMMLGMCVLAMIVVGIAWLLTPAGRAWLSTVVRRGPPTLTRSSGPPPAPSLTQLCISLT